MKTDKLVGQECTQKKAEVYFICIFNIYFTLVHVQLYVFLNITLFHMVVRRANIQATSSTCIVDYGEIDFFHVSF